MESESTRTYAREQLRKNVTLEPYEWKGTGIKSTYTPELGMEVLEYIAAGNWIYSKDCPVSPSTLSNWRRLVPGFREAWDYAKALRVGVLNEVTGAALFSPNATLADAKLANSRVVYLRMQAQMANFVRSDRGEAEIPRETVLDIKPDDAREIDYSGKTDEELRKLIAEGDQDGDSVES